jgi:hypothetical protein
VAVRADLRREQTGRRRAHLDARLVDPAHDDAMVRRPGGEVVSPAGGTVARYPRRSVTITITPGAGS